MTIIGAAASGLAAARLLHRLGAKVFVSESAPAEHRTEAIRRLDAEGIAHEFGGHTNRAVDADAIVVSPGVPHIPILDEAARRGIPIHSELDVAGGLLTCSTIAVTGTNGKTTTTALIGAVCRQAGLKTIVAGNIGSPLSDHVESSAWSDVAVIEVSSFQAEGLHAFHPRIGVLLNLSPDHLDRYDSVEAYYAAKRKLFEKQTREDYLVVNADDPLVHDLTERLPARKLMFGFKAEKTSGTYVENDEVRCHFAGETTTVLPIGDIALPGRHNLYNAMAAVMATRAAGISLEAIRDALRTFKGVEHRLEFVRTVRGIRFINDSKATNVDAAGYALDAYRAGHIVWIAGGKHKGAPYTPLARFVSDSVRCMVLIGQAAPLIEQDLGHLAKVIHADSMDDAVRKAFESASSGDVVLLSPACSSFDMFENYEDRGRRFKTAVHALE